MSEYDTKAAPNSKNAAIAPSRMAWKKPPITAPQQLKAMTADNCQAASCRITGVVNIRATAIQNTSRKR
jgi:hypothetical protein